MPHQESTQLRLLFDQETAAHDSGFCEGVSLVDKDGRALGHLTTGKMYRISHAQPLCAFYDGQECTVSEIEGTFSVRYVRNHCDGIFTETFYCELSDASVSYTINGSTQKTQVDKYRLRTIFADTTITELM